MIYSDYKAAELAQLPGLIADPAYSALKPDGRHVQALWLATHLGRPALTRFNLLQRATWAAVDPALRRRLVERLVAEGPALIDGADIPDERKRHVRYFIVNALRELGHFDEALALIDAIERGGPPIAAPADPDSMYGPGEYAPQMRAVIAAKDMSRYPIALMPPKWAAAVCARAEMPPPYGPHTAATKAACARRQAEARRQNEEAESAVVEMGRLMEDPAALNRACAATPQARRTGGLAMACESVEGDRDRAAAEALAKDGARLAADCEATPPNARTGGLEQGCSLYQSAIDAALAERLASDDSAFAILCPGNGLEHPEDRASSFELVCMITSQARTQLESERLQADPAALDARCAAIGEHERDAALGDACMRRRWAIEEAGQKLIAADPKAFASRCGRFSRELSRPDDYSGGESDELRYCRKVKDLRDGTGPGAPPPDGEAVADFSPNSSLSTVASARAASIIATAKATRTYPKRGPGDTD